MPILTGVSLPRLIPLLLPTFLTVGWQGTLGAHNRQHAIVPDSLGALGWACQTHYGNDRTAELEHSLLHREEKTAERGSRVNISRYFAFCLPPSTWCDSSFIVFYYITKISQCKPYIRGGNGITWELGNGPKELTAPRGEASSFIPLSCPHTGHVRDAVCWGLASSAGTHRIHFPSRVRGGAVVELDHLSDWGS